MWWLEKKKSDNQSIEWSEPLRIDKEMYLSLIRGTVWGIVYSVMIIFGMTLILPYSVVAFKSLWILPAPTVLIALFIPIGILVKEKYVMNSQGVVKDNNSISWKNAIGYFIKDRNENLVVFISKEGKAFSSLLPIEPLRSQIIQAVGIYLPKFSDKEIEVYSIPIKFSIIEITAFTLITVIITFGEVYFIPILFKMSFGNYLLFLGLSALMNIPVGLLVRNYVYVKFPQYSYIHKTFFYMTVFLMTCIFMLFSSAYFTKIAA